MAAARRHGGRRHSVSSTNRPYFRTPSSLLSAAAGNERWRRHIASCTKAMTTSSRGDHDHDYGHDGRTSTMASLMTAAAAAMTASAAIAVTCTSSTKLTANCESSPPTNEMARVLKTRRITLAATSPMKKTARCESSSNDELSVGEDDDNNGEDDGGDDIVGSPISSSDAAPTSSSGPVVNEANGDDYDNDGMVDEDEETTCSICLINRQGPCRNYWLKFEKCMKEHGREMEKDKNNNNNQESDDGGSNVKVAIGGESNTMEEDNDDGQNDDDDENIVELPSRATLEAEWDTFMIKSTRPGDDDDDDEEEEEEEDEVEEEEEDEEDEEDEVEEEDEEEELDKDNADDQGDDSSSSLAERCDKFMIPWIGCIQEHRNIYTLISNSFYRNDYIDPLELSIPDERCVPFRRTMKEEGGVVKFHGVEIDLGNWKEYIEADNDERIHEAVAKSSSAEPHLINAYARFHLMDPDNNHRPIEVAYVKDQNGTVLGFDSFSKQREEMVKGSDDEDDSIDDSETKISASEATQKTGECTFHIIPGVTTSIVAYAVYRGDKDDGLLREDVLYYTPEIPLSLGESRK